MATDRPSQHSLMQIVMLQMAHGSILVSLIVWETPDDQMPNFLMHAQSDTPFALLHVFMIAHIICNGIGAGKRAALRGLSILHALLPSRSQSQGCSGVPPT